MNQTWARVLLALWGACFVSAVYAKTFLAVVMDADYVSAGTALVVAFLAGFVRTTMRMADKRVVVIRGHRQGFLDLVYAMAVGLIVYILVESAVALWWPYLPDIVRYGAVLFAGAFPMDVMRRVERWTDKAGDRMINLIPSETKKEPS